MTYYAEGRHWKDEDAYRRYAKYRKELEQNLTPEVEAYGKQLVAEGYLSTSSRHRHVARVPPGRSALEVLEEVYPKGAAELRERLEEWARMKLLRGHLGGAERLELTPEQFMAFKRAGGRPV